MELASLVTCLQLFGIGFTFGIAGPCLLFCVPILATYVAASQNQPRKALVRIALFLSGRTLAYAALGYLDGLSGELLRRVTDSHYAHYFKPMGGVISIALGMIILLRREQHDCACKDKPGDTRSSAGFFIFGFLIGCAPCAPLAALLAEIVLISRNAFQGAVYGLSFGAGTFLSGLIAAGVIAGVIGLIPARILKFEKGRLAFRIICAILLILLGITLLW